VKINKTTITIKLPASLPPLSLSAKQKQREVSL